ncbi:MAG: MFS transporter [Bifidobacteriaceae bacterium]|nr:MFS transporter [Bifidobacteriaceae bacterium]
MSQHLQHVTQAVRDVRKRLFGGYAELLKMPHTARFSIGAVIACMPYPMVGMTITISVQHFYNSYALAGQLSALQAIILAASQPLLGKLTDKFGQRQVAIPAIIIWMCAATALISCINARVPEWILFCIVPFISIIPPWGAMSRKRWAYLLKDDSQRMNRALSLSSIFDECMWVVGNPLASTLAVISGVLSFSVTGLCVVIGALMFLTELSTEPPSQTQAAQAEGISRKEYRKRIDEAAAKLQGEEKKKGILGPGLIALCATWFTLGAFQSATSISIIAFATEQNMRQYTGFVFACFSFSSLIGAMVYGAKNWRTPLWKRYYICLAVVNIGISTFLLANHLWVIMTIYLLIGICQSPTWINGSEIMLHLVPSTRFTEGMSLMNAMNAIGSSIGSAVAGIYIDSFGSKGGFAVVTCMALSSLAIAFTGFKQIKSSIEKPSLTVVEV